MTMVEESYPSVKSSKIFSADNMTERPSSPNQSVSGSKSRRKTTSLPPETVEYLKNWMMSPEHIAHPYPTEQEKAQIMTETGIELKQLTNWFVNNRKRFWKPRVEARLQEQSKVQPVTTCTSLTGVGARLKATSVPVSPDAYQQLVHVVSTPNVCAMFADQNVELTSPATTMIVSVPQATVSEISCASSETGSVGMNMDTDEMSTGQTTTEEPHQACKEVVDMQLMRQCTVSVTVEDAVEESTFTDEKNVHRNLHNSTDGENVLRNLHKRRHDDDEFDEIAPRPKYRRQSIEIWKKVCEEAHHGYCASLPTLEEAARLFGYAA